MPYEPSSDLDYVGTDELIEALKDRFNGVVIALFEPTSDVASRTGLFYKGSRIVLRGLLAEANDHVAALPPTEDIPHDDSTS